MGYDYMPIIKSFIKTHKRCYGGDELHGCIDVDTYIIVSPGLDVASLMEQIIWDCLWGKNV